LIHVDKITTNLLSLLKAQIMKISLISIIIFFLMSPALNSQRANNWYFGTNAGLNFGTTPPTILTNGMVNIPDNTSTISDLSGNLLFYTDGQSVWNKNHAVMPNGSGLTGNYTAGQCAVIVPVPCSTDKYAIFHVTEFSSPGYLKYSVVDMSLAGGLGDVVSTQKNVSLGTGWTEKLCAIFDPASNSYWVLTHKWNSADFVALKVSATGIATQSVVTTIGSVHNCGSYSAAHDAMGQLTISRDGTKVINALTCQDHSEIFDFNLSTGQLSNSITITGDNGKAWGTAFSPDSKKVYTNSINGGTVRQFDLSIYTQTAVSASEFSVAIITGGGYQFGYMELGPDGKIYIARPNKNSVSVIGQPNSAGAACGFSLIGQSVGTQTSSWGMSRIAYNIPSTISGAVLSVGANPTVICQGKSSTLTAVGASTYNWSNNATGGTNVVTPQVTTTYTATAMGTCAAQGMITVSVIPSPAIVISGSTKICFGKSTVLTASGANSYQWSNGPNTTSIAVTPTANTIYAVTGTNQSGCVTTTSAQVTMIECTGFLEWNENKSHLVFPVPASRQITATGLEPGETVIFYDVTGRFFSSLVIQSVNRNGEASLDVSEFPIGLYFLRVGEEQRFYRVFKN
jgi:hypothetical protein